MRIKLTVTNDLDGKDQVYEVVADNRDVRKFESEFQESWIATDLSMTQMTQIAWVASRRFGLYEGDYASFDKINVDVKSENLDKGEVSATTPT